MTRPWDIGPTSWAIGPGPGPSPKKRAGHGPGQRIPCPTALSYVLWPCPMSYGLVICPVALAILGIQEGSLNPSILI